MQRMDLRFGSLAIALLCAGLPGNAQLAPASQPPSLPPPSVQSESSLLTFRITTREVVVDVIAVDGGNRPVTNLHPGDLEVSSQREDPRAKHRRHKAEAFSATGVITSFHLVDPATSPAAAESPGSEELNVTTSCLDRARVHYQLGWRPDEEGLTPGYHQMVVQTRRRGVRLFYRHSYYIGATEPLAANRPGKLSATWLARLADQLHDAACYQPHPPPSIALHASLIETGRTNTLRYSVTVDATSLSYISLSDQGRRVQLDYAVCNFNARGQPISYFTASVDAVLGPVDYTRALSRGFPHILEFPRSPGLALSRFVARDRMTGNIGLVDVMDPFADQAAPDAAKAASEREAPVKEAIQRYVPTAVPPQGPIGSFGSIVPEGHAFCGDVYEIPGDTNRLPDFRELDPIASIYTDSLAVPNQLFVGTAGIPGVTPRVAWFGIDYRATFYIRTSGEHHFRMVSDDGAILQIDDQKVIDLDGAHMASIASGEIRLDAGSHTIHVPYFQGPIDSVALQLWVKPPNAAWKLFDLRDFLAPQGGATPPANGATTPR